MAIVQGCVEIRLLSAKKLDLIITNVTRMSWFKSIQLCKNNNKILNFETIINRSFTYCSQCEKHNSL